ncbi:hypothetical protein AVEN_49259-1 [Araneus ventricosus]|uniref:Uncharacterized protein n=1 Tax=Araneus ventricosus TaxID=182803 RepID=A0A4Y2PHU7_ARAVE|nr:hypothetical protein AVEN_49259-1 [Araneus ventricosus]
MYLQNSNQNDIPLPNVKSFDNSYGNKNTGNDECENLEDIQEDVSILEALYLANQQSAFDEFVRPKRRSPINTCLKWLFKHVLCCLRSSVIEHKDNNRYLQHSNENDIRRISEFAELRIFDYSHETRNMSAKGETVNIQEDASTLRDSMKNYSDINEYLQSSYKNDIPLPKGDSFDKPYDTSNIGSDYCETEENNSEEIQMKMIE